MRGCERSAIAVRPSRNVAEERRQPLHIHLRVGRRIGARHHQPVFQRIAGAGRRLRAIVQHPPAAVRTAADIGGIEMHPAAARRLDADHRPQELLAAGDDRRGKHAVGDQKGLAIDIARAAPRSATRAGRCSRKSPPIRLRRSAAAGRSAARCAPSPRRARDRKCRDRGCGARRRPASARCRARARARIHCSHCAFGAPSAPMNSSGTPGSGL